VDLQYYQIWGQDQTVLVKSPTLANKELPNSGIALGQFRFADLKLPDGRAGRLIEIAFIPRLEMDDEAMQRAQSEIPSPEPITMVYARERSSLDNTLYGVAVSVLLANLLLVAITTILIWKLVGRGLAPLSNLAKQVSEIDESNLTVRLSHSGEQSREIAPIENQLNHLLERLQSAFDREKRFSANVAHELRTPISELKTLTEVGRMVTDQPEQIENFFQDVKDISGQMEKVVTTLLELTRLEAGLMRNEPEEILLSEFCNRVWSHAANGSGTDRILVNQVPEELAVYSDRDKLGIILVNLFTNALCYSPDNAEVIVRIREQGGRLLLEVQNATMDLKVEDIVHMRDRFWRKNKAQDKSNHSGLGLTLVDALAHVMKMDLHLDLDDRGMFRVGISGLQVMAGLRSS
ncbi:MAG: histidine kinase dimerization/phospho-acceptor domain-containing protein, partial [Candidatus Bathyarchaeota archaeon]